MDDLSRSAEELKKQIRKIKVSVIKEIDKVMDAEESEDKRAALSTLFSLIDPRDIPSRLLREYRKNDSAYSLRLSVFNLILMKQSLPGNGINNLLRGNNPKDLDKKFAEKLGIPCPKVYGDNYSLKDIPLVPSTIVKPYDGSGSNGVFYIDDDLRVKSIKTGCEYSCLVSAVDEELVKRRIKVTYGRWILEQAVLSKSGEVCRELKVYSFYGENGLYYEAERPLSDKSIKVKKNCYYDSDCNVIYNKVKGKDLAPLGVPREAKEYAQNISKKIPLPFCRIDFLRGGEGIYLGEITAVPGWMWRGNNLITNDLDVVLGRFFVEAQARLHADLLKGKSFGEYSEIYSCGF